MDAILLREAGGLGDILQVGSVAEPLVRQGYRVHLYTLPDTAILTLAGLIRGISHVHALQVTLDIRRPRGGVRYGMYEYLTPVLAHARGATAVYLKNKNRLFDMFCPAWKIETEDVSRGRMPRFSRAQAFGLGAGLKVSEIKPSRLRIPRVSHLMDMVSLPYIIFSPWSRDPARSARKHVYRIIEALAESYSVLVLDYGTGSDHKRDMKNVLWYPQDFGGYPWRSESFKGCPDRQQAVRDTVGLVANSAAVVAVDTFCLHVAGSTNRPTVLLDGPTVADSVARHYNNVSSCPTLFNECRGCYYEPGRGFSRSCRTEGCRVIDAMQPEAVVAELDRKLACAHS